MGEICAERLIGRLADWGVDTVFGLPGDGINGIMEGLRRHRDRVRFVLVQHEEAAAFMATAHAKATGRLGVCLATSGPGGIHLLNGLYDAKLDHAPVLAITGAQETGLLGSGYQQEVDLTALYADVAEYNLLIGNPQQLPGAVDGAIRTALARRGVAHLCLPNDVQLAPADADPYEHGAPGVPHHGAPVYPAGVPAPTEEQLERAARLLNDAKRPAILAGAGALGASRELARFAEAWGAPVMKTLPGKAALPDDSPFTVGGLGLLGTRPSAELVDDIDTLLMVGTNFPYTRHLPSPQDVRVAQIDTVPERIGVRLPVTAPILGDAAESLRRLTPMVRRADEKHLARYQKKMGSWREEMAAQANAERSPIAPQYLAHLLNTHASDDALLACDSGTVTTWAARHWDIRGTREFYLSSTLASMANGLPYAIAAQLAYPDRQVIAFVGDGGFAMLMAEFLTAVRHGLPIKVVINNNGSLGQILWEQMVLGYPEHGVRFGSPRSDFAGWAQSCGVPGTKVTDPVALPDAVRNLLSHNGPALLDVDVNPDEPPLPGKISYQQAVKFAESFLKGQPRRKQIATTLFRDRIQKL
ncbi:pyruvate dehydrogenase (quinone)/pyruvate oxidase [Crossiella equi]|uniref:Pyruvate dehydrogenase (Quinone)/pyruvate oxidase n=3 Tax=Crossiella equi TaxID=130796 RepID=A0ABS5A4Z2_9PSEU|nr:thiamine pyrophosphate-dependent enzyme [Crossiella equi]MBP2471646.1 pyruvate dehydrogenase (quinone)/pyruvate oxidase [Crossiella equi]